MWLIIVALISCLLATFYIYVKQCHSHFRRLGIPNPKPTFFIGNLLRMVRGKEGYADSLLKIYRDFPDEKYVGFYKFLNPTVLIRDPELITQMLSTDFIHFCDNDVTIYEDVDFILSKILIFLKGHKWKTMRALLAPMFSTGKLKNIFPLSLEVAHRLTRYIQQEINASRNYCMDGKSLCLNFNIDNIAICAFGIEAKAFEDETKFTQAVKIFNKVSYWTMVKFVLMVIFPRLNKFLKIRVFDEGVEEYLTQVISEMMKYRKENNIIRNDFFDQITALKEKCTEYPFTDRDVVAQGGGFFLDSVETSATTASYVLLALARYPNIQKKVREEISRVIAANNGEMTYEGLNSLNYLDAVIQETVRVDNPVGFLFKVCTKSYTLPEVSATNKTKLVMNPGDSIVVSINGLHFNPDHFPEPHAFKPERFLGGKKDGVVKNTYIPFGLGPRTCVGMRFAFLQIKLIVISIVGKYQVDVNEKMLPFKSHPNSVMKRPLQGFWFDIKELRNE